MNNWQKINTNNNILNVSNNKSSIVLSNGTNPSEDTIKIIKSMIIKQICLILLNNEIFRLFISFNNLSILSIFSFLQFVLLSLI